eukprot:PhM_4_TR1455/c0_g1_i1/m.8870
MSAEDRRARLKGLLTQQLQRLHERATSNPFPHEFISGRLDALLKSGTVKDADIRNLAVEARSYSGERANTSQKKEHGGHSKSKKGASSALSAVSQQQGKPDAAGETGQSSKFRSKLTDKVDLWAQIVQDDVVQFDKEQMQHRSEVRQRMGNQREHLDSQIQQIKVNKHKALEQEKVFAEQQKKQLDTWNKDVEKAEQARREQLEMEKRIRDEQMKALAERKHREAEQRRREDEQVLAKIKQDMQREQELQMKRKEQAAVEMKKFAEFNAQQKQEKVRRQLEEIEVDKKHQALFLQKLEKQEWEREEALRKLYERQTKQIVLATKMSEGMNERSREDEIRAAKEQERISQREAELDKKRQEKTQAEKRKLQHYLALQVREKDKQRGEERHTIEDDRRRMQAELAEAEEKERSRKAALRQKEEVYRRQVEDQMKERREDSMRGMSAQEYKLNAKLLQKLQTSM